MEKDTQLLIDVYQALYGPKIKMAHLDELASDLSEIAGRDRPWTGQFLHSLLKGYPGFNGNGQFGEALTLLASHLQNIDEMDHAQQVTVKTLHHLPAETVILGQAKQCAAPTCHILFVPTHPQQKYHSKACAETARRLRRKKSSHTISKA
jgi:hypothetical protein